MALPVAKVFNFGERLGLVFIVEAACLSAGSILALLGFIWYKAVHDISNRRPGHADLYFFSLLIADLTQATGGVMDLKWAIDAHITEGPFCVAQGALKQVGDTGVALSSMAIAIDTFAILFYRWYRPKTLYIPCFVLSCIWIFIFLAVAVPYFAHKHYFSDTEYWCWIGPHYLSERLGLEYVWMWSCAILLIFLYVPLFFRLRGNLVVTGWKLSWRRLGKLPAWSIGIEAPGAKHARTMLWYPVVYFVTVAPMAIARWTAFSKPAHFTHPDEQVPFAATSLAGVLFSLSGFFNVLLYSITRPGLIPTRHRHSREDLEAAATSEHPDDAPGSIRASLASDLRSYGAVDGSNVSERNSSQLGVRLERSITTQGTSIGTIGLTHPYASNSAEAIQSLSLTLSNESRRPLSPNATRGGTDRPPRVELT